MLRPLDTNLRLFRPQPSCRASRSRSTSCCLTCCTSAAASCSGSGGWPAEPCRSLDSKRCSAGSHLSSSSCSAALAAAAAAQVLPSQRSLLCRLRGQPAADLAGAGAVRRAARVEQGPSLAPRLGAGLRGRSRPALPGGESGLTRELGEQGGLRRKARSSVVQGRDCGYLSPAPGGNVACRRCVRSAQAPAGRPTSFRSRRVEPPAGAAAVRQHRATA